MPSRRRCASCSEADSLRYTIACALSEPSCPPRKASRPPPPALRRWSTMGAGSRMSAGQVAEAGIELPAFGIEQRRPGDRSDPFRSGDRSDGREAALAPQPSASAAARCCLLAREPPDVLRGESCSSALLLDDASEATPRLGDEGSERRGDSSGDAATGGTESLSSGTGGG